MEDENGFTLRRELDPGSWRDQLAADVREGLAAEPKRLPPKYFYDERGSRLFERITRLPEYYQTRTERRILERVASTLVEGVEPRALVEYGSGSAGKTGTLLEAMAERDRLEAYGPVDVSEEALREAARRYLRRYPQLRVEAVLADFESTVRLPFAELPRLVLFLGSTIGNFRQREAVSFLRRVREQLSGGEGFLVGFDLVKSRERLESAYDDEAGVTARFNRNVLRVVNRELDADFDPGAFEHRAFFDPGKSRIEMHLVSRTPQRVRVRELDLTVQFEAGESLRTELSYKYTRASARELLEAAGLEMVRWDTDPQELFALALARRA